ncbi:MAG: response regulator [Chloroflexota bacterium]|nr:response regulator [Chloroflexota bacterium]
MNPPDSQAREIAALRERLSRLGQASLRITRDLDFNSVLQGALDSARSLTNARYGVIVLHDGAGVAAEFLSSGMTAEETGRLWTAPGWAQHFQYLAGLAGPLRVPDLPGHLAEQGLPGLQPPVEVSERVSFLAFPVDHQGERVGSIYLAEKRDGEEFSREDEDTLALFAAQAALAIANARQHREERRARADLETLVDTSPVGVVVFDAATGAPVSFNREALRIVDGLRGPEQAPADLLNLVTLRRADGREISLQELPLAQLLRAGETVRAEEVALRVPDGRSVSALLNATPIMGDDGAVESFVVTLQDLTPLEEAERLRADFLAMVSHELLAPLTSIKGSAGTLLGSAADMDPALARQFFRIIEDQADHMKELVSDLLDVARIESGSLPVSPEPAEVLLLVDRARSAFSGAGGGNPLEIDIDPDLPLVLADRRRIVQVLVNLLTNAARHCPPSAAVRVSAARDGVHVAVSVIDEGRGIPSEQLPYLFRKFSGGGSGEQSGEPGGNTGLGLAICKGIVEAHGGRIRAESDGVGLGARFTFTLPTVEAAGSGGASPAAAGSSRRGRVDAEERVRVLAVDDNPNDLRYARETLADAGYAPLVTGDPEEALRLMAEERPQLVLLDLMLPGADGVDLMQAVLEIDDVPVVFISAYGREDLVARAFDMGAADYVVKPFSPTELAARIRAALRRRAAPEPLPAYAHGGLAVDFAQRRATLGGEPLDLVSLEYRLLEELAANAGRVLTYERLLERVWGRRGGGDLRPMRAIVSRLRSKLGDDADRPTYVFTEPRVGYWVPAGEGRG